MNIRDTWDGTNGYAAEEREEVRKIRGRLGGRERGKQGERGVNKETERGK